MWKLNWWCSYLVSRPAVQVEAQKNDSEDLQIKAFRVYNSLFAKRA